MERISREQFIEKLFEKDFDSLRGQTLRITRLRVPGREVCMAHILTPVDRDVYKNLGLEIGTHEGEDHTGDSIGMMYITPWESVIVAADTALKSGNIEIGFMDRFCGELLITGPLADVRSAITQTVDFFRDVLGFEVCEIFDN